MTTSSSAISSHLAVYTIHSANPLLWGYIPGLVSN